MAEWKYEGPTVRTCLQRYKVDLTTNAGLWFEVFPPKHKQKDFGNHYQAGLSALEAPAAYSTAYERRRELLRKTSLGVRDSITRLFVVTSTGRFIVGLGAASVSETGIELLRPWGLPYLPGSSLKGIASAAAHARGGDWASPEQAGGQPSVHHEALFGSVNRAGCVVFHDAWWIPAGSKLPIALDVMTPHHMKYNGGEGVPPLDTDSPTPVSFLTCTGSYLVALTGPADWLDLAWKLLKEALENDGVGAKTAAGYGRFTCKEDIGPEERARREKLAQIEAYIGQHMPERHMQAARENLVQARSILGDAPVIDVAKRMAAADKRFRKWLKKKRGVAKYEWLCEGVLGDAT